MSNDNLDNYIDKKIHEKIKEKEAGDGNSSKQVGSIDNRGTKQ